MLNNDSGISQSVWMRTAVVPDRPPLREDVSADVCIVGAGIAGLTTAYMLARKGVKVIVLDDGPIGGGATGRTTAHLASALDDRYFMLEERLGEKHARLAAESHAAAINAIEAIVRRVEALKVGHGLEPGVEVGPIINARQLERIEEQVADAVAKGARVLTGGRRLPGPGTFYAPTVLTDVTSDMLLMQEETFGPILPILAVDSVDQMIAEANASPFGLSATVWGRDLAEAERVARRLEAGTVWVNTALDSYGLPQTPRGGFKDGGIGKVGGEIGLMELVEAKLIDINRSGKKRPWWFPAGSGLVDFFEGTIQALHGDRLDARLRGGIQLLKGWPKG